MMETFLEDAEYSLHHRNNAAGDDGSECSGSGGSSDSDDPFLYDKFLPDPDWSLKNRLEEEEEQKTKNMVDPGPFRYNKRILVSCCPGLLVVFALGGESLILMVAVATAIISLMSQLGDSRRCVVVFIIFFIPTHIYVLSSVIPLLWLSGWHLLSVVAVNLFVILTAGWVIIQFKAFRTEEIKLAVVIELALFTLYPVLGCGLFCWSLTYVIQPFIIPIIFSIMWFAQLQIYLVPTLSSFRHCPTGGVGGGKATSATGVAEENLDVLQVPIVILIIVAFVWAGPFIYVFVILLSPTISIFSWISLVHLVFTLSLTLFLLSLLSIRQIFEYIDVSYSWLICVRWLGGLVCTLLSYPVLHDYGLDSHFLSLLPVAIAIFAALGVVLSMKKRNVIMAVLSSMLTTSLVCLFLVWIQSMPHNLQHYFLGYLPLNGLYFVICANFLLCLLSLGSVSVGAIPAFGLLLCLQAVVVSVCEVSLHNSGLYSSSLIQLSTVSALYAIHRLHLAEKISRRAAILSSCVHLARNIAVWSSMILDKARGEITAVELILLAAMMYAVVSVFMYGHVRESSRKEIFQHLCFLLCGLAASGHHLLLPATIVLFQGSHSYTFVLGLWCIVGASLVLLYSQIIAADVKIIVLKVALTLGVLGTAIITLNPRLSLTFYSMFQWGEMVNCVALVGLFSSQLSLSPQHSLLLAIPLAVCPAVRMCYMLWPVLWLPLVFLLWLCAASLLILLFVCVAVPEINEDFDRVVKFSVFVSFMSSFILLGMDVTVWMSGIDPSSNLPATFLPVSLWQCPAWKMLCLVGIVISVTIKIVLTVKTSSKLPITLTATDNKPSLTSLPMMCNVITVFTFLIACTQGLSDPFLHDLWCCLCSIILCCLHGDRILLPQLSGEKQAAPVVLSPLLYLLAAAIVRSRLWMFASFLSVAGGVIEILLLLVVSPVYFVLWTVLWYGKASSEASVVFLMPFNALLFFTSSGYTAWLSGFCGLMSGIWMMAARLPMVPYNHIHYHDENKD